MINEEKLKILNELINKRLESSNEFDRCWATGAYYVLRELGIVKDKDWVNDIELERR